MRSIAVLTATLLLAGCGRGVPGATGVSGSLEALRASDKGPAQLEVYYAFDDYHQHGPEQVEQVKALHADLAAAAKPDGPRVFLAADMQAKGTDFRTRVTPGQAWGQGFDTVAELATDHTSALRDFLSWSEDGSKPRSFLSIHTHGGAKDGLLWDYDGDPNGESGHVTLQRLAKAVAKGHQGGRVAELNFDACMMASIEVGEAIKGVAEVYSGSEDFSLGDSTPYGRMVSEVQAGRATDGASYGRAMVDAVVHHGNYGADNGSRTWSAIKLDRGFDQLVKDTDRLAGSLVAAMPREGAAIKQAVKATHNFAIMAKWEKEYGDYNQRDLVELCQLLQRASKDAHVQADARAVEADVKQVLVGFAKHPSETMANGLAIFLPVNGGADLKRYRTTSFGRHTRWANFLATL
ncbi:MAG: peptidase clostripain [Cyanobacteria bacterium RYN_339]|nr:peptidase clostripain [Cyanobacteria bacterium RYN_339]